MKQPCLAQQHATTPVASKLRWLLEFAAFTAQWFRQDDLWMRMIEKKWKKKTPLNAHHRPFLRNTQVFHVLFCLCHISVAIRQRNILIWSSHPYVISVEISIGGYRSANKPVWVCLPVWGKIYSRLRTGGTEYSLCPRGWWATIGVAKSLQNLKFVHLSADPNQFLVSILGLEVS